MEYRNLEIKVISAKDLNKVNLITKMDVYVVVSISGGPKTKQKTTVDRDGDTNPAWNFPMKFTVEESAVQQNRLSLVFKLICERSLGDKDVGEVHVPVKDLIGSVEDGKLQFVTYQVRKPSGKPKGELNLSYKWGEKVAGTVAPPPAMQAKADEPVTAYPPPVVGPSSAYPYPPPPAMQAKADEPVTAYPAPVVGPSSACPYPPPPAMQAKADEPVTACPAPVVGPSSAYPYPPPPYAAAAGSGPYPPPPGAYPPPPPGGYAPPPMAGYGYPPPPYSGHPPPPTPPGYGYPPPQPGYGYPPAQQPARKDNFGLGMGAGLLGGAVGGLLIGDMISDAAYDGDFCDGGF